MLGFNGGLMGVRKVPTAGSASGLWLPNEQCVAKRVNIWPAAPGPNSARYFRLANFADTALNDNSIDFGEIEVYNQDFLHTGITCTSNIGWYLGQDSNLVDGVKTTDGRSYMGNWSSIRPTTTITLDLGSTKTVTHIKIFSLYTQPRFPASFDLQSSSDNVTYEKIATVTVGTNFTSLGGFVYSSAKVAIL